MSILNETQLQRDQELATILKISLKEVEALPIATPDAIRISDGNKPKNLEDLYHDYEHLNFPAYLRTLMKTSATRRHPELFKLLKETKNKRCLDFGSGVATHSIALMENNNFVIMLDVPGKLQEFASTRVKYRMDSVKRGGMLVSNHHALYDNYYDVVICSDTLEHVQSPLNELRRIYKSMKDGGILHLLVSEMRKISSGHFDSSIDEWIQKGKPFMKEYFKCIKPSIYIKK